MNTYTIPDNPTDPEAAALELIVRLPADLLGHDEVRDVLQDYCGALDAEGAFAGLSWPDAKAVATAILFDVTQHDDAVAWLRYRARNALSGADNMPWCNRDGAARALNIAATVLGL